MVDLTATEHFGRMQETANLVWPMVRSIIASRFIQNDCAGMSSKIECFLKLRDNRPLLRPYIARIFIEAYLGENWKSTRNLEVLAAIELLNTSTYLMNYLFDLSKRPQSKGGWDSCSYIASSMFTGADAIRLVCRENETTNAHRVKAILDCNDKVYAGQYFDSNVLNFSQASTPGFLDSVRVLYDKRCRFLCGSTIELTLLPVIDKIQDPIWLRFLHRFLNTLGAAIQSINDLADLTSEPIRFYSSGFNDLKNKRLTLPYILLLESGITIENLRCFSESISSEEGCAEFCNLIKYNGIMRRGQMCIREMFGNELKRRLRKIYTRLPNAMGRYFQFVPHIVFQSRMYKTGDES